MANQAAPTWYLYGAGGFGLETLEICISVMAAGTLSDFSLCFIADGLGGNNILGYPVVELRDCQPGERVTIAVGEPDLRSKLAERARAAGLRLTSAISPTSIISPSATIEDGVIIAPLCSIQARAFIGRNSAINTMSIVGHDVQIAEDAVVSSMVNLGGAVRIGSRSYIGMGGLIREKLIIGADTIVSMGSVVHHDIQDEVIAMGNPARVVRRNEDKTVFRKRGE